MKALTKISYYFIGICFKYFSTEYDPNWGKPDSKKLFGSAIIILAVKSVLFGVPPLIIGIIYQSQCQVQEWIPRFLMVLGIETIAENLLLSIAFVIMMIVLREQSEVARHKALELVKTIGSGIAVVCSLAWYIAGSVWTFSVKNQVEFDDSQKSNYCHPAPYWFAFVFCVLWYLYFFVAILCIPCIWKYQKNLQQSQSKFNPVQLSVKY